MALIIVGGWTALTARAECPYPQQGRSENATTTQYNVGGEATVSVQSLEGASSGSARSLDGMTGGRVVTISAIGDPSARSITIYNPKNDPVARVLQSGSTVATFTGWVQGVGYRLITARARLDAGAEEVVLKLVLGPDGRYRVIRSFSHRLTSHADQTATNLPSIAPFSTPLLSAIQNSNVLSESCSRGEFHDDLSAIQEALTSVAQGGASVTQPRFASCLMKHGQGFVAARMADNFGQMLASSAPTISCASSKQTQDQDSYGFYDEATRTITFNKNSRDAAAAGMKSPLGYYTTLTFHESLHMAGIESEPLVLAGTACCVQDPAASSDCATMDSLFESRARKSAAIDALVTTPGFAEIIRKIDQSGETERGDALLTEILAKRGFFSGELVKDAIAADVRAACSRALSKDLRTICEPLARRFESTPIGLIAARAAALYSVDRSANAVPADEERLADGAKSELNSTLAGFRKNLKGKGIMPFWWEVKGSLNPFETLSMTQKFFSALRAGAASGKLKNIETLEQTSDRFFKESCPSYFSGESAFCARLGALWDAAAKESGLGSVVKSLREGQDLLARGSTSGTQIADLVSRDSWLSPSATEMKGIADRAGSTSVPNDFGSPILVTQLSNEAALKKAVDAQSRQLVSLKSIAAIALDGVGKPAYASVPQSDLKSGRAPASSPGSANAVELSKSPSLAELKHYVFSDPSNALARIHDGSLNPTLLENRVELIERDGSLHFGCVSGSGCSPKIVWRCSGKHCE